MHGDKLIWGFIYRSMIWGYFVGWLTGFMPVALMAVPLFLDPTARWGSVYMMIFALPTTLIGVILGVVTGFVNGLMIGLLTHHRVLPVQHEFSYRALIGAISAIISAAVSLVVFNIMAIILGIIPVVGSMVASLFIGSWYFRIQSRIR
jgi:hypothetical protein